MAINVTIILLHDLIDCAPIHSLNCSVRSWGPFLVNPLPGYPSAAVFPILAGAAPVNLEAWNVCTVV